MTEDRSNIEALVREAANNDSGYIAEGDPGATVIGSRILLAELLPWTKPLIEQLRNDPMPRARSVAVGAGEALKPDFLPVEYLTDPDAGVRKAALDVVAKKWLLCEEAYPDMAYRVDRMLSDPSSEVRIAAADTLLFHCARHDPAALIERLNDEPEVEVRESVGGRASEDGPTHRRAKSALEFLYP